MFSWFKRGDTLQRSSKKEFYIEKYVRSIQLHEFLGFRRTYPKHHIFPPRFSGSMEMEAWNDEIMLWLETFAKENNLCDIIWR